MCEILTLRVQRRDDVDETRNTRRLWHEGYIIQVQSDGYPWARRERKQAWIADGQDPGAWPGLSELFLLPGVPVDAVLRGDGTPADPFVFYQDLILPQNEDDDGNPLYDDGEGNPSDVDTGNGPWQLRRRLWQVSETLPGDVTAALDADGEYTVAPIARFNSFVKKTKAGDTVPPAAQIRAIARGEPA